MTRPRLALVLAVLPLLLPACGGGGGGGGGGATADVLIGDAPSDDLLSFSAVVQSVRLQREDLSFTGDLVSSLEVEFLGLNGALVFLAHGRIPAGTYVALEVGFAPGGYLAQRGDDGSAVTIVASENVYLAPLPAPLAVATGDYVRLTADLDLLSSLSGDASSGSLDFSPSGNGSSDDGSEDAPIDELKGRVLSKDLATRLIRVDGFVGPQSSVHLGTIEVHVGNGAVLLDNDNQSLSVEAFFAALIAGTSFLEVHGNLALGGTVEATRLEIEDDLGGGGGSNPVRIEGFVTDLSQGSFGLRIRRIKDGASIAQPVLDGLGNPDTIQVSFDQGTLFVFDTGGLTDSGALANGQEVQVRFASFTAEPFAASEIEIDDTPGLRGTLGGGGAGPGTLALRLERGTDALRLDLEEAAIQLALPGTPALEREALQPGLVVEARGRRGADGATLRVERLLVRPGLLSGAALVDASAAANDLVVDGGRVVDPFGAGVRPGPLRVLLPDDCAFRGEAASRAAFFERLAAGIPAGATVDVVGLGTGTDEVRARIVRLRLP